VADPTGAQEPAYLSNATALLRGAVAANSAAGLPLEAASHTLAQLLFDLGGRSLGSGRSGRAASRAEAREVLWASVLERGVEGVGGLKNSPRQPPWDTEVEDRRYAGFDSWTEAVASAELEVGRRNRAAPRGNTSSSFMAPNPIAFPDP